MVLAGATTALAIQQDGWSDRSSSDRECLARAMYFESQKSSEDGMLAVGTVVANRLKSGRYGSSLCGVVGQHRQFAPGVLSRRMEGPAAERARRMADAVLSGKRHPGAKGAMFFHAAGLRFGYSNMHYVLVAGGNAFYEKRPASSSAAARANALSMARVVANAKADQAAAAPVLAAAAAAPRRIEVAQARSAPLALGGTAAPANGYAGASAFRAPAPAPAQPNSALAAVAAIPPMPKSRVVAMVAPVEASTIVRLPSFGASPKAERSTFANRLVAQAWAAFR